MHIVTYLTFNGNCREAMMFYKECLGGELDIQTVGDSPMACKMPEAMNEYVLHSMLQNNDLIIMGSDMVGESGLLKGNSVSILLNCDSEPEARAVYARLSIGGIVTHPLENSFWGALFGDLIDKFGNQWLINYDRNQY